MALSKLEKAVLKEAGEILANEADSMGEAPAPYNDDGEKNEAYREKLRDLAACLKCTKVWPL